MTSDAKQARVYLSLGSNIEPEKNLPAAVRELARFGKILAVSQVWQTPPAGWWNQPDFLNGAVLLETVLSPRELRSVAIAQIESKLGRVRDPNNKNAPRTIDIDIALYNYDVLDIDGRHIPDPDIETRAFVTVPLAALDPDYCHPDHGQTLSSMAAYLKAKSRAMKLRADVRLRGD
jgi:2-amino-4-hydroxy-6-hydroxymethyldihydropteridine diphosphokinase